MPKRTIETEIAVEGEKQFRQALAEASRQAKVFESALKELSSEMAVNDDRQGLLARTSRTLQQQLRQQKEVVSLLEAELAKTAAKYGENSRQAQDLQVKLNNAKTAMNKTVKETNRLEKEMEDLRRDTDKAGRELGSDFTDDLRKASREMNDAEQEAQSLMGTLQGIRNLGAFQVGMDLAGDLLSGIQQLEQYLSGTREERREKLLVGYTAEEAGIPAEAVEQEVLRVAGLTGDIQQAREGVGMLLRIEGITADKLSAIVDNLLGLDLKSPEMEFPQLSEGFLETAQTRQVSGAMLEALEKTGYQEADIERVNSGLRTARDAEDAAEVILTEMAQQHYVDFLRKFSEENTQLVEAQASEVRKEQAKQHAAEAFEPMATAINNAKADFWEATAQELETINEEGVLAVAGDTARKNLSWFDGLFADGWNLITTTWGNIFGTAEKDLPWYEDAAQQIRTTKAAEAEFRQLMADVPERVALSSGGNVGFQEFIGFNLLKQGLQQMAIKQEIETLFDEITDAATDTGAAIPADLGAAIEQATPYAVASAQSLADQVNAALSTVATPSFAGLANSLRDGINVTVQPGQSVINMDGRKVGAMVTPYISTNQARQVKT